MNILNKIFFLLRTLIHFITPIFLTKKGFIEFKYFFLRSYYFIIKKKFKKFRKLTYWNNINYNRIALINYVVSNNNNLDYLEIGCDDNFVFNSIPIKNKIGIDPNKGGNIKITSDDFFKNNTKKFDLIFIDGLHEYKQCQKDIKNSLNVLKKNGIIMIHDLLPVHWITEHVPRISDHWNGDIWKVIFEIIDSINLSLKIVDIDNGVGILKKKDEFIYDEKTAEMVSKDFNYFVENIKKIPVVSFEEGKKFIDSEY